MRACDVMTKDVVSVRPSTTIKEAAKTLGDRGFTALPVIDDDGRVVGVVSEADLVRDRFLTDPRYRGTDVDSSTVDRTVVEVVGDVMTTPAAVMSQIADIAQVAKTMLADRHRFMPIVDGSVLVGVVTRRDLVAVLARTDAQIAADVRGKLAAYGGSDRWTVGVREGDVTVQDEFDDATDRHVALVLAEAVPGVVHATVRSVPSGGV
jgi:CBS domain-containing protein